MAPLTARRRPRNSCEPLLRFQQSAGRRHALELWDSNGWTETLTVAELTERALALLEVATGSFPKAFNCFLSEALMDVMMPAFKVLPRLIRGELSSEENEAIGREHQERLRNLFSGIPFELSDLRGTGEDPRLAELVLDI